MGTVHKMPNTAQTQVRLLENLVRKLISEHPDPEVAERWSAMAEKTIARYPGPPSPSDPVIDLSIVEGLNDEQIKTIEIVTEQWLCRYLEDVHKQLLSVHRDLLALQKKLAELEVQAEKGPVH